MYEQKLFWSEYQFSKEKKFIYGEKSSFEIHEAWNDSAKSNHFQIKSFQFFLNAYHVHLHIDSVLKFFFLFLFFSPFPCSVVSVEKSTYLEGVSVSGFF